MTKKERTEMMSEIIDAWNEARRCLKHFPSDYHMEDVAEVSEHFERKEISILRRNSNV